MSRRTLVAAAALVCLTPAGCGGDNGQAKAAFVREADAICGKANQLVRALGPEPPILTDRQADWILALTEIDRNALKNLRALEPPRHERPMVASMISLFERGLEHGEAIARASRAGNDAVFRRNVEAALESLSRAQASATRQALRECALLGSVVR